MDNSEAKEKKEARRCYIITAYLEGALTAIIAPDASDYIICADAGYEKALAAGLRPDLVIGDFDSTKIIAPDGARTAFIRHPIQKDESDTFLCVKHAVDQGFRDIIIAGGLGGRLDHTVSNLQTLARFAEKGRTIALTDAKNTAAVLTDSSVTIPKKEGLCLSLFSLSDVSAGVTTEGLRYPLRNATLTNTYPIGLSNEFSAEEARVEVRSGKLLVVLSGD